MRKKRCDQCNGSGQSDINDFNALDVLPCSKCNGCGYVEYEESGVSYEKCYSCSHSTLYYLFGGGAILQCKITGKSIAIKECVK